MLQVRNIVVEREGLPLFKPVSFVLSAGQLLHLQGNNGVGKTTLLKALLGVWPYLGEVVWLSSSAGGDSHSLLTTAYVGHAKATVAQLTVAEQLRFSMRLARVDDGGGDAILSQLDLAHCGDAYPHELSQGQAKRLSLAPLFFNPAVCWLLDEPFSDLDQQGQALLLQCLRNRLIGQGNAVLLTSHAGNLSMTGVEGKCLRLIAA